MVFAKAARKSAPKPSPAPAGEERGAFSMRLPSRKTVAMFFPLLAVTTYLSNEGMSGTVSEMGQRLRKLATVHCIHNIYATEVDVLNMVPVPDKDPEYVPAYIAMCYEWIRRDAYSAQYAIKDIVQVNEHVDVCLDWTAPHYAMMEILSASVLNTVVPHIKYRHNCPDYRTYDEAILGYDWATFQSVFQEPAMMVDQELVDPLVYEEQCKICLQQYDSDGEFDHRSRSRSLHHCFAYPETFNGNQKTVLVPTNAPMVLQIPSTPSGNNIVPLSSIVDVLRTRLYHSASEWAAVTDTPPAENTAGTVIFIDENSLGIDTKWYGMYTPADTSSIIVMISPLCTTAYLRSGEKCIDYANSVVQRLKEDFPDFPNTGFQGGPGIDLQIPVSTAGSFSRMMLADKLICPPDTHTCLLPALGRKPKPDPATMFVGVPCPTCPPGTGTSAADFFNRVGTHGATEVVQLPDDESPTVVPQIPNDPNKDPVDPTAPNGQPVAPAFPNSLQPVNGDAFINDYDPPPTVTQLDIQGKPSLQIYQDTTPKLPQSVQDSAVYNPNASPISVLPNVIYHPREAVPTPEEAQAAKDAGVPLDNNYLPPPLESEGQPPNVVSTELAADESLNFVTTKLTADNFQELATLRRDQKIRQVTGYDRNFLFEIPCPGTTENENVIIIEGGYVITDNNDTVVMSDSATTAVFQSPVTINTTEETTQTDPITGEEENCAPAHDPISDGDVCIPTDQDVQTDTATGQINPFNAIASLLQIPGTNIAICVMKVLGTLSALDPTAKLQVHLLIGNLLSIGSQSLPQTDTGTLTQNNPGNNPSDPKTKNKKKKENDKKKKEKNNGYVITKNNKFDSFEKEETVKENYAVLDENPCPGADYAVPGFELAGNKDDCGISGWQNPVYVREQKTTSVVFDLYQTWKGLDSISWVAIDYDDIATGPGTKTCPKEEEQPYGQKFSKTPMEARCSNGFATFEVYIHDGSKNIGQQNGYDPSSDIPARCNSSKDVNNKCFYQFSVPCTPGVCPQTRRRLQESEVVEILQESDAETHQRFAADLIRRCGEQKTRKIYRNFKFGGGIQNQHQPDGEVITITIE